MGATDRFGLRGDLRFCTRLQGGVTLPGPVADHGDRVIEVEPGKAVFEGLPEQRHYNPIGTVHGGYALTLMDSCMSCAVQTLLKQGEIYTTLELKVNLVRAITKDTGKILATGRIIHRGRTTGRRCFAADGRRLVMPAFGAYTGGLNVRDRAFAQVFESLSFTAHMLGEDRLYPIAARRCLPG